MSPEAEERGFGSLLNRSVQPLGDGGHRVVMGLKRAAVVEAGPYNRVSGKSGRSKNKVKARGIAFEKKFGKRLRAHKLNFEGFFPLQWIYFIDGNGEGFAQPDFFLLQFDKILLFECKLTEKPAAWQQMEELYVPLLEHLFQREVLQFLACRNLGKFQEGSGPKPELISIEDALYGRFKKGIIFCPDL